MTIERKRRGSSSSLCKAFSFMGEHNQDNNISNKNIEASSSGVLSTKELVQDNIKNNNNNNGNSVVTCVEYPRHGNNYAESSDRMNNDTNNNNSIDNIMSPMKNTSVFEDEDVCSGKKQR